MLYVRKYDYVGNHEYIKTLEKVAIFSTCLVSLFVSLYSAVPLRIKEGPFLNKDKDYLIDFQSNSTVCVLLFVDCMFTVLFFVIV